MERLVNCHTTFGQLKQVVVGVESNFKLRDFDTSFKIFYKDNLNDDFYTSTDINAYHINNEILNIRIEQLNTLAKILENEGVTVYRPDQIQLKQVKTPYFSAHNNTASNVRDLTFIYKNYIIETPPLVRSRYFENLALNNIFKQFLLDGNALWFKAPLNYLSEKTLDLEDWKNYRNFEKTPLKFDLGIDGAQFLPIGKDIIVNISTYNHWLGFKWIKKFFTDVNFYTISTNDNHLDGSITCLKPGVFLIRSDYLYVKEHLPQKYKNWKYIVVDNKYEDFDTAGLSDIGIQIASAEGMDINVLSLNENTVLVNKRAISLIKILEQNKFNVIPIELDYGEIFGGGIHCSTLDIQRNDEFIDYTK